MKLLASLFVILVCTLWCANGLAKNSVQTWGTCSPNQFLVLNQIVSKGSSFPYMGRTEKDIRFPGKGQQNFRRIACIEVTDQHNDPQATALIKDGGIGFTFVNITVSANKRKGFNFIVKIFVQ